MNLFNWLFTILVNGRILAPMMEAPSNAIIIPDHYIVMLKAGDSTGGRRGMNALAMAQHETWLNTLMTQDDSISHTFNVDGLHGYAGRFNSDLLDEIRGRPEVAYIEPDQVVYAYHLADLVESLRRQQLLETLVESHRQPLEVPDFINQLGKLFEDKATKRLEQADAPWGLSRVSQRERPALLDRYVYPESAGKGVDVYIIDTGINIEHEEFEGRARWGKTIPLFDMDIDGNGHGTHCAGTIGGKTFGLAKKANLYAVKVLRTNGFGTNADVIKGVEWVIREGKRRARTGRKAVANMSLGGGRSISLERVVNRAVASGIHFAVAAGNDNEDACNYSPAAAKGPVTVGASTRADDMAFFSNHGSCVDIFAPGLDILSTWIGAKNATNTISGTSMASPHVAGVMALYLAERDLTPEELKAMLIEHSGKDLLSELPDDTENRLLSIEPLLEEM